jgi:hypothetical protein
MPRCVPHPTTRDAELAARGRRPTHEPDPGQLVDGHCPPRRGRAAAPAHRPRRRPARDPRNRRRPSPPPEPARTSRTSRGRVPTCRAHPKRRPHQPHGLEQYHDQALHSVARAPSRMPPPTLSRPSPTSPGPTHPPVAALRLVRDAEDHQASRSVVTSCHEPGQSASPLTRPRQPEPVHALAHLPNQPLTLSPGSQLDVDARTDHRLVAEERPHAQARSLRSPTHDAAQGRGRPHARRPRRKPAHGHIMPGAGQVGDVAHEVQRARRQRPIPPRRRASHPQTAGSKSTHSPAPHTTPRPRCHRACPRRRGPSAATPTHTCSCRIRPPNPAPGSSSPSPTS